MSNAGRFLNIFCKIEEHVRREINNNDKGTPFLVLIKEYANRKKPGFRDMFYDLEDYSDLRNILVHNRRKDIILAEPTDFVAHDLERIHKILTDPPRLKNLFSQEVKTLHPTASLADAVELMYRHDFSQIPIVGDDGFIDLLTNNTIARWLGAQVSEDIFSLGDTKVKDVLAYEETHDNWVFADEKTDVLDAVEMFRRREADGNKLEAIFITANGKKHEKFLGIMTIADIPKALETLQQY